MKINTKLSKLLLTIFLLMQYINTHAQSTVTEYIRSSFVQYTDSLPREEIYIHTDRSDYIAGEYIWFNVYLTDRQTNKPVNVDRIAYFELLDPENRPVIGKKILLDRAHGQGEILLPDTLSSGTYTIRAYTNRMKNFLPANCFMKDISIYNALSTKAFKRKIYTGKEAADQPDPIKIPNISGSGLTLRVNNVNPDTLELLVSSDKSYRSSNGNVFNLFIQTHGVIDILSTIRITNEITKIIIPKTELLPGINQITLFDSQSRPLIERYIYTPRKKDQELTINSSGSYKKRSKVSLELIAVNEQVNGENPPSLSIAVVPLTSEQQNLRISDYMVFGSEFGVQPWIFLQNRNLDGLQPERLDSLLLSLNSRWIDWRMIFSGNRQRLNYRTENRDHYLSGKLLTAGENTPVPDEYLTLSIPGKVAVFQYAKTDINGNFSFRIHIDEAIKDLIIRPDNESKNLKINFETPFSNKFIQSYVLADSAGKQLPDFLSKWSVNYQVNKIYETSFTGERLIPDIKPVKPRRFYGKPDVELVLADYTQLPVMVEVFFELLPGVPLRSKKSGYEISMYDQLTGIIFREKPGMMIDGVIIKDPSIIGNLDPEFVEKIDIVKERYMVGNYIFYGIINIITKAGDFSNVSLPDASIRMPYRVVDPVFSFSAPDYSNAKPGDNHIPDFRNTLYWNPSVKPGIDGKYKLEFWTSDVASEYEINIQGINGGGKPVFVRKVIKVE